MKQLFYLLIGLILCSSCKIVQTKQDYLSNNCEYTYFKDSIIAIENWVGNNGVADSVKTYYRSGNLSEVFYYDRQGRFHGMCYQNNDLGELMTTWTFSNGKLLNRVDLNKKKMPRYPGHYLKKYEQIDRFNSKHEFNPESVYSRFFRASIRYHFGNYALADYDFRYCEKALEKNEAELKPIYRAALFSHISDVCEYYEAYDEALKYKKKAMAIMPNQPGLHYSLANFYYLNKAYGQAEQNIEITLEKWPNHVFSHWLLASMYTDLGNYKKALEFVNVALANEKKIYHSGLGLSERDVWVVRAWVYHQLGQSDRGIIDLRVALTMNPNNSFAHRNLGAIYCDLGQHKLACEHLKKARKLHYEEKHDRYDLQEYYDRSISALEPKK